MAARAETEIVGVRVPVELVRELRTIAAREERTLSGEIRKALHQYLVARADALAR